MANKSTSETPLNTSCFDDPTNTAFAVKYQQVRDRTFSWIKRGKLRHFKKRVRLRDNCWHTLRREICGKMGITQQHEKVPTSDYVRNLSAHYQLHTQVKLSNISAHDFPREK